MKAIAVSWFGIGLGIVCAAASADPSVFTVDIAATSNTTVGPGGTVTYELVGLLSGTPSYGLALWAIDLHSSYSIPGGLPQLDPGPEMGSFVKPDGLTNPAGYGGTPLGDDWLLQIGGAQNTIGYEQLDPDEPDFPTGEVVLGIGFSPVVLATGVAHLPEQLGTYQLELSSLFGNVIVSEGVGDPPVFQVNPFAAVIGTGTLDIDVIPEPSVVVLLLAMGVPILARRDASGPCASALAS